MSIKSYLQDPVIHESAKAIIDLMSSMGLNFNQAEAALDLANEKNC